MVTLGNVINRATCEYRPSVDLSAFDTSEWIHNPDMSGVAGVPQYYWKISGDNVLEMDASEKAAQDTALGPGMKATKSSLLENDVWNFVQAHYPVKNQITLSTLWTECVHDSLANRYAYIKQGVDWIKLVYQYYYQKIAEIQACTTLPQIDAVAWDFAALAALDPQITVYAAMQIPD